MIEADIADFDALLEALREDIDKRYVIDVLGVDDEEQVADTRLVERRTGLAANLRIPFAALAGREFQALSRVHLRISEMVGTPPFVLRLGNRKAEARATRSCAWRSSSSPRRASSCSASRVSAR